MAELAPLEIFYLFDNGKEVSIAQGTISDEGVMDIARTVKGQEAAVATLVSELNGSDRVFLRDARTSPETGRAAMVKIPVDRGNPDFLDALKENAKRFYKVDLRFNPAVFDGGDLFMLDMDDDDADDLDDDTPDGPDMTPVKDALPGLDV